MRSSRIRAARREVIDFIAKADQTYQLTQRERIALGLLAQHDAMTARELAAVLELSAVEALQPWIKRLLEWDLIQSAGRTQATRYFVDPGLLRHLDFAGETTLKRIEPHRGLRLSDALIRARQTDVDLLPDLKAAIARAAAEGKPYTKTGGNGVYERRHELPEAFHAIGKHRLAEWVGTLLDREELVMAMVDGCASAAKSTRGRSSVRWMAWSTRARCALKVTSAGGATGRCHDKAIGQPVPYRQ